MMISMIKKLLVICGVLSLGVGQTAYAVTIPNDPRFSFVTPIYDQIGALRAWDTTTGSKQVVVAVLDSGVDMQHPDLRENIWHNPNERLNGLDDDNNGFVDDMSGWDFVSNDNDPSPIFDTKNQYDFPDLAHGTVVAGLIGAVGNNNTDAAGIAWRVSIMPIRVMDEKGTGHIENVVKALRYAQANGAFIVNLSFGGNDTSAELESALKDLYEKNVLTVVAAGNHDASTSGNLDFSPVYPACADQNSGVDSVLTVASINEFGGTSSFSNYGSCIDLVAPGERISSTIPYEPTITQFKSSFSGYFSGTSMSAPLVAGAAVLVKTINPDFTAREVKGALYISADPVEVPLGNKRTLGYGKLNIERALRVVRDTTTPPPTEEQEIKEEHVKDKALIAVGKRTGFGEVRFYDTNFGVIKDIQLFEVTKKTKTINYAFGNDSYGFPVIYAAHDGVIDVFTDDADFIYALNPKMTGEITVMLADVTPESGNELIVSSNKANVVKVYSEQGDLLSEIKNPLKRNGGLMVSQVNGELYISPLTNTAATVACGFIEAWSCAPINSSKIAYQYFSLNETVFQSRVVNNKGILEIPERGVKITLGKASLLSSTLIEREEPLLVVSPTGKVLARVVLLNQAGDIVSEFPAFEKYSGGVSLGTIILK